LLFFTVDHNDFDACERERAAYFIALSRQW
jgi:hypothetical protein